MGDGERFDGEQRCPQVNSKCSRCLSIGTYFQESAVVHNGGAACAGHGSCSKPPSNMNIYAFGKLRGGYNALNRLMSV